MISNAYIIGRSRLQTGILLCTFLKDKNYFETESAMLHLLKLHHLTEDDYLRNGDENYGKKGND